MKSKQPINVTLKHFVFKNYFILSTFLLACCLAISTCYLYLWLSGRLEVKSVTDFVPLATGFAGVLSTAFVIQKQHNEEVRIFVDLFKDFNVRYDELNEAMNSICLGDPKEALFRNEFDTINSYFNLCAEEYLWFRKGYIDKEVWEAWRNGMKSFLDHERIRRMWENDKTHNSYYGLENEFGL